MTPLEAMKQALEALEARCGTNADERKELIPNLHAAIEEMEQAKPVAYLYGGWQLLTPDEVEERNKEYDRNSQEHDEQVPLYTHPAPIPEGWQLVPIEPTKKMIDAACQMGISVNGRPIWKHTIDKQAIWKWKTMLAAAPKPEE